MLMTTHSTFSVLIVAMDTNLLQLKQVLYQLLLTIEDLNVFNTVAHIQQTDYCYYIKICIILLLLH